MTVKAIIVLVILLALNILTSWWIERKHEKECEE
jgi:uncharacterized membrane protein YhfC